MATKPSLQLKVWRISHEIPQSVMADQLGVSQGHLSAIEGGWTPPGRDLAVRIEDMTGIPVRDWSTPASESETTEVEAIR